MNESKKTKFKKVKGGINVKNRNSGITLIALVVTILFCYDELLKYSSNNSFLPITNLSFLNI